LVVFFFVGFCVCFSVEDSFRFAEKRGKKWGKEHKESNDVFLGVEKSKKKLLKSWHPLRFLLLVGTPVGGTPIEENNNIRKKSGEAKERKSFGGVKYLTPP
jgi:hypothetical protein